MLMHRFEYTKLTRKQIDEHLTVTKAGPECASKYTDVLAGKSLKIITDNGPVLNNDFKDKNTLVMTEGSEASIECGYGALTLKHVIFFSHSS